jgi:hypothetical protein
MKLYVRTVRTFICYITNVIAKISLFYKDLKLYSQTGRVVRLDKAQDI